MSLCLPGDRSPLFSKRFTLFVAAITFLFLAFQVLAALMNIPEGDENHSLVLYFDTDEGREVANLQELINNRAWEPMNYEYGMTYYAFAWGVVQSLHALGYRQYGVDASLITRSFRIVSLAAYLASILAAFLVARQLTGENALAVLAGLGVGIMPEVYHYAQVVHPDTLQLAFLLFAVWFSLRDRSLFHLCACGFLVGLAFGTKHFGILIFPFVLSPYLIQSFLSKDPFLHRTIRAQRLALAAVLAAFLGWVLFNWQYLFHLREWIETVMALSDKLRAGGGGLGHPSSSRWDWFRLAWDELTLPGAVLASIGSISLVAFAIGAYREAGLHSLLPDRRYLRPLLLLAYVLFCFGYMFFLISYRETRFLMPFLPFLIPLATCGLAMAIRRFQIHPRWSAGVVLIFLAAFAWASIQAVHREAYLSNKRYDSELATGGFLIRHYDPRTTDILHEMYAYVPPRFHQRRAIWGITAEHIVHFNTPDLLIITRATSGRWIWKQPGTRFADRRFQPGSLGKTPLYEAKLEFFNGLFSERSIYRVVYETDKTVILERRTGRRSIDDVKKE